MAITGAEAPLVSERLVLRRPVVADAPAIADALAASDILPLLPLLPDPYTLADAEQWAADPGPHDYLACRADDGRVVAALGLRLRPDGAHELGYWTHRDHRGQGYVTEASRRLIRHAFETLGVTRLIAAARDENLASRRVLAKLGFTRFGEETRDYPMRGISHRMSLFGIDAPQCGTDLALPPVPTVLVSAVALVDLDGRVLIARRPPGKSMAGLWEFPGGKVDPGETPEAALVRELREELGIDTAGSCLAPFTFASHRYERFHLLMPLYLCRRWRGDPTPKEGQELAWVRPVRLADYPMPPADMPLVAMLRDFL